MELEVLGTSTVDRKHIRERSLVVALQLGYKVSPTLPLLDEAQRLRSQESALERFLCLHAAAACAYGMDRRLALRWLEEEMLHSSLTQDERYFIERTEGEPGRFRIQIEGMWALAWALGIAGALDFGQACPSSFVHMLPNLKHSESSTALRRKAALRGIEDIASAADLAYCLHWAIRQAELGGSLLVGRVETYVIVERRRALDWLLSVDEWDQLTLDT